MSVKFKLCMIGCGKTASKHASALMKNNFEITHVTNFSDKKKLLNFAKKFKIKNIVFDKNKIFKSNIDVDGYVVVVPTKYLEYYTKQILKTSKPALIEKPISTNINFLKKYRYNKKIMVGFNKRYYKTILEAKKFLEKKSNCICNITLPESVINFDLKKRNYMFSKHFTNSVHIFDIIAWIFGKVLVVSNKRFIHKNKLLGYNAVFKTKFNNFINLFSAWNSTENYNISINNKSENFKIQPLEKASIYKGFELIITKQNTKIYKLKQKKIFETTNLTLAPGFEKQAKLFYAFCKKRKIKEVPLLKDALSAQQVAATLALKDI